MAKNQNKNILEQDGIKCFDLERQSIIGDGDGDGTDFDLRKSLGLMG